MELEVHTVSKNCNYCQSSCLTNGKWSGGALCQKQEWYASRVNMRKQEGSIKMFRPTGQRTHRSGHIVVDAQHALINLQLRTTCLLLSLAIHSPEYQMWWGGVLIWHYKLPSMPCAPLSHLLIRGTIARIVKYWTQISGFAGFERLEKSYESGRVAEVSELADGTKLRAGNVTLALIGFVNSQQTRASIALCATIYITQINNNHHYTTTLWLLNQSVVVLML